MFDSDELQLIREKVLAAQALVSSERGRCPVRVINLMQDLVQHYRDESFGKIPPSGRRIRERTYGEESREIFSDYCRGNKSSAPGSRLE